MPLHDAGAKRTVSPGSGTSGSVPEGAPGAGHVVTRRAVIAGASLAVLGALGARIAVVNARAPRIPERVYGLNEWLDLDECYLGTEDNAAPGLGFMLTNVELMSPNEYLSKYARDGVTSAKVDNADGPCLLVTDMKVRNTGSEGNAALMFTWHVVGEDNPVTTFDFDSELFTHSIPELGGEPGFRVTPGTEPVIHVPFRSFGNTPYFVKYGTDYRPDIADGRFRLKMTDLPERRLFRVTLPA